MAARAALSIRGCGVTAALRGARWVVAASALVRAGGQRPAARRSMATPVWPTLAALAAGLLARAAAPGSTVPLLVLLAWRRCGRSAAGLATGSSDPQLLMPWLAALGRMAGVAGRRRLARHRGLAARHRVLGPRRGRDLAGRRRARTRLHAPDHRRRHGQRLVRARRRNDRRRWPRSTPRRSSWRCCSSTGRGPRRWRCAGGPGWPWHQASQRRAAWRCGNRLVDLSLLSREPWIRLHRAAGTLYDANAMGALAALAGASLAAPASVPGACRACSGVAPGRRSRWPAWWRPARAPRWRRSSSVPPSACSAAPARPGAAAGGTAATALLLAAVSVAAPPADATQGNAFGRLTATAATDVCRRLAPGSSTWHGTATATAPHRCGSWPITRGWAWGQAPLAP